MLLRLVFCTLKFLLSSLSIWLLILVIFEMWVFHFRSDCLVIQRYLAFVVVANTWPLRVYSGTIGFLFTGLVIFSYFVGLNFINQSVSHSATLLISYCSFWQSSSLWMSIRSMQSSANRHTEQCLTLSGK